MLDLHCPVCDWREVCGREELQAHLLRVGMLKRSAVPEEDVLLELIKAAKERLTCPECGQRGLDLEPPAEEQVDWEPTVYCEVCGDLIPRERLEAFPNARVCAECQARKEAGAPAKDRKFCPRCGQPMEYRKVTQEDGRPRFILACKSYPDCRAKR